MTELLTAVRYETGDSDPDNGIFPERKQFTQHQFSYAAEAEGVTELDAPTQAQIYAVSAKILEMASAAWAAQPIESVLGPASEVNETSDMLAKKAAFLRNKLADNSQGRGGRVATYAGTGAYVVPPGVN